MGLFDKITGASSNTEAPPPPPPATTPPTVSTAEVNVRLGFIRKVYTLLTINFLITIGISCAVTFIDPIQSFLMKSENFWVLLVALGATIVSLIVLVCIKLPFPFNLIMMYVFVLCQSVLVGFIVSRYYNSGEGIIVLQAFILTAATFLSITFYCAITKNDFSFLYGFLGAGMLVLILAIVFNFAFAWVAGPKVSRVLSFVISVAGYELSTVSLLPVFSFFYFPFFAVKHNKFSLTVIVFSL